MTVTVTSSLAPKPFTLDGQVCEVRNVSQIFRDQQTGEPRLILRDVNFAVPNIRRESAGVTQGQVWSILGLSGRGKTTLGRILAALDKPTTGEVLLNDTKVPVRPGEVGFVFQDFIAFDDLTVRGNLMYAAYQGLHREHAEDRSLGSSLRRLRSWYFRRGEISERALQYVGEFSLEKELSQYPHQLSGGQRQRLAILMQVLCSSRFIVLDEPFSGQDPLNRLAGCELVKKVALLDEEQTLFVITHDVDCAVYVSDTLLPLGYEKDPDTGKFKPGATTYQPYSLAERGLAWQDPSLLRDPRFMGLVQEIKYDWYPNM